MTDRKEYLQNYWKKKRETIKQYNILIPCEDGKELMALMDEWKSKYGATYSDLMITALIGFFIRNMGDELTEEQLSSLGCLNNGIYEKIVKKLKEETENACD